MKKRLTALTLSLAMTLALTACGGGSSNTPEPAQSKAAEPAQSAAASAPEDKPVKLRMASVVANSELEARNTGMAAGLMTASWPPAPTPLSTVSRPVPLR